MKLLKSLTLWLICGISIAIAQTSNLVNIATIAKLRQLASGTAVNVQGYNAANDGGGGVYVWNATSTAPDNGGTIIQATGVTTGRWLLQFTGAVNVKWFGAKGDGVSDDTAAMQACFDSVRSACNTNAKSAVSDSRDGPASILIPRGTYLLSDGVVLYAGVSLIGEASGPLPATRIQQSDYTKTSLYVVPKNYSATWANINPQNGTGNISDVCFSNSSINDSVTTAPSIRILSQVEAKTFMAAYALAKYGATITGDGTTANVSGVSDFVFRHCWWQNTANAGISADDGLAAYSLIDCTFDVARRGCEWIGTAWGDLRASNTDFFSCVRGAIYVSAGDYNLDADNCWFFGCGDYQNSTVSYRNSIYIANSGAGPTTVDQGIIRLKNCWWRPYNAGGGTKLNGPVRVTTQNEFGLIGCSLIDIDSPLTPEKYLALVNVNRVAVVGSQITSSAMINYTNARLFYFFSTGSMLVNITGNNFVNSNGSSLSYFMYSDSALSGSIVSNTFIGPSSNVANSNVTSGPTYLGNGNATNTIFGQLSVNNLNPSNTFVLDDDTTNRRGLEFAAGASPVMMAYSRSGGTYLPLTIAGQPITLTGAPVKLPTYTVGTLPSAASAGVGATAVATDLNSTVSGDTAAGGGSGKHLVMSDGASWIVQ